MRSLARWWRMRSNEATQATASPSMIQGARPQMGQRIYDQREATSEVIAGTAVEPHLRASLAGNDAKAVVLDLMQPLAARRQLVGFCWEARRDEPGREGTHTQHNAHS